MKGKIPKQYNLFATTISVEFNDEICVKNSAYGLYSNPEHKIYLATKCNGYDVSDDRKIDTFYHEKVHSILNAMSRDEALTEEEVDIFAKLWRQSDETAVYK